MKNKKLKPLKNKVSSHHIRFGFNYATVFLTMTIVACTQSQDKTIKKESVNTEMDSAKLSTTQPSAEQKSIDSAVPVLKSNLNKTPMSLTPPSFVENEVIDEDDAYDNINPPITDTRIYGDESGYPEISNEFFDASDVEEQPKFGKNDNEFYEFLSKNLVYPKVAKDKGITGTVWVTFFIDRDGTVSNIKTDGKEDPSLEEEAKRLVKLSSGNWTPAKYKGKSVRMICKIPIDFDLE